MQWSTKVETCIQTGLQNLITRDFSEVESDPVTCTSFEKKAIEKVNDCYYNPEGKSDLDHRPELCQLLGNGISEQIHRDLTTLVKAFHVGGDYHVNTVDRGIPELVRECGHHEVANSLYIGEPRLRVIFCTWAFNQSNRTKSVDPAHYVTIISRHLNDSESNFQYGGTGLNNLCAENLPNSAQDGNYDFHVVTWFALPNNTMAQDWNETIVIRKKVEFIIGSFFEFSYDKNDYLANRIRDYSKCGNGRRDPGEMCDYAMLNSSVCSLECEIEQPIEESERIYECSTDRLQPSYCWLQQCGDGSKTSAEECDDGNRHNGDGCSSQCRIETPQFTCNNRYNQTSICKPLPTVIATHRQITRSNVVHEKHTESTPLRATVDMPLDSRGLSSAGQLISRTGLVLLTAVLATLWTVSTLA